MHIGAFVLALQITRNAEMQGVLDTDVQHGARFTVEQYHTAVRELRARLIIFRNMRISVKLGGWAYRYTRFGPGDELNNVQRSIKRAAVTQQGFNRRFCYFHAEISIDKIDFVVPCLHSENFPTYTPHSFSNCCSESIYRRTRL